MPIVPSNAILLNAVKKMPRSRLSLAALALAMSVSLVPPPAAWAKQTPQGELSQGGQGTLRSSTTPIVNVPSLAPLVKQVRPAVVSISVVEKAAPQVADRSDGGSDPFDPFQQNQSPNQSQESPFDQLLRRFFAPQGPGSAPPFGQNDAAQREVLGSGFIIDPSGYIVTNNHVVKDPGKVTVTLEDGSKHVAKIIGTDPKTDLALLKIDAPKPLPYVRWGNSDDMHVGDWVVAIGDPFGLGGSISPGTIAARGRDIASGPYDDYLQIDASINRGNSGGPSFNLDGQVIGINTAIYSPNGGSVGIGFAIPSNVAKSIVAQLKEHGKVVRGWLGVEVQQVSPALAQSLGLPKPEGALVSQVMPDSPAAKAGFKQGDVVLSFDGHDIAQMHDLPIIVSATPLGQTAAATVWRDKQDVTLNPVIAQLPSNLQVAENGGDSVAGLDLAPLAAADRERLHIPSSVAGVMVTAVAQDSPLSELGLQPGDVIESINQKPVARPEQAVAAINAALNQPGGQKQILMLLNRQGSNLYVAQSIAGNRTG